MKTKGHNIIQPGIFIIGWFVILGIMVLSSCKGGGSFSIEGTIVGGGNRTIYIEELTPDGPVFLDSIHLDKEGNFEYEKDFRYQTFYNIHTNELDYVVILPEKDEKIRLRGDYRSLQWSYEVEGSYGSMLLWQIQDYSNYGLDRLTKILTIDEENKKKYSDSLQYMAARVETDSIYIEAFTEQLEYMSKFIQDNKGSLATLIALYKPYNRHNIISPMTNFDYYELVLEGLEESCPDNPHTIHFKNRVENLRHLYGGKKQALDLVFDGE